MKRGIWILAMALLWSMVNIQPAEAAESLKGNKAYMDAGKVIYETYDTTAASGIVWRTEGFTVKSKECPDGNPMNKPYGTFWLKDENKESTDLGNGKTHTVFTFSEKTVSKAFDDAGIDGDALELSGGNVYLNGIFRVYRNGSAVSGYKRTLEAIKNAAAWRNPDDFKDHFNIKLSYKGSPQPVYLTTMKKTSSKFVLVSRKLLTSTEERRNFSTNSEMIPGTMVDKTDGKLYLYRTHWAKWSDEEKEHSNGTYRKVRDRVQTEVNPVTAWESYKESLKALRLRKYSIPAGGLEIVCVYKHFSAETPSEDSEESGEGSITEPYAKAVIQADIRGQEAFDSEEGIPTSECQYVNVITNEYLAQYEFKNYSGTKTYQKKIPGKTKPDGTKEPDTYKNVTRKYSYWKIESLNVYRLFGADIENESLPQASLHLSPSASYHAPAVSYTINSSNMKEPQNRQEVIGQIKVRNDRLVFNGTVIMDGGWQETSTDKPSDIPRAGLIDANVLYESGLMIPEENANGEYESAGTVTYERICHYGGEDAGAILEYDIEDINDVLVHTPVICDAGIEDVRKYNQLIQPNQSVAGIILDRYFWVKLPTEGYHTEKKGYEYRDYDKYIARREVRFPFDIYKGKTYYKANTWIKLTTDKTEFYLPIWVDEGEYTVEFRSRAINCDANDALYAEEELANADYENYVAADSVSVEVSGRIYGLTLYDISDAVLWKNVFRKKDSLALTGFTYKVGDNDQNGALTQQDKKYTFVMLNGSHPEKTELGVQKTGYVSRFYLTTIGNLHGLEDYIHVKPSFYFIDSQGNRTEVDLYYTETIEGKRKALVKAGSNTDMSNQKAMSAGNVYTSVPQSELVNKAVLENKPLEQIKAEKRKVYTFSNIMIPQQLRTYIGQNYTPTETVPSGVDSDKVSRSMQRWYFEYYLPSEIHICEKGFDVEAYSKTHNGLDMQEAFWLKSGYLLVNYEIQTIANGERRLSYSNLDNEADGYCNMWKLEGYQYRKSDSQKTEYSFKDGDTLVYQLKSSAATDYLSGGTH